MTISVIGTGGTIAEVDGTTFRALRVTMRPVNHAQRGSYRVGMLSGTMAAALAADSEIFQFRWAPVIDNAALAVLYRLSISAGANVAATVTSETQMPYTATVCRSWTAAGSGGTRADLTDNNGKRRQLMAGSMVNDMGIASTAALSAGTKVIDATSFGMAHTAISLAAITVGLPLTLIAKRHGVMFDASTEGNQPIVMMSNEGFIIRNRTIFPASMTWNFGVDVSWAEVAEF